MIKTYIQSRYAYKRSIIDIKDKFRLEWTLDILRFLSTSEAVLYSIFGLITHQVDT